MDIELEYELKLQEEGFAALQLKKNIDNIKIYIDIFIYINL